MDFFGDYTDHIGGAGDAGGCVVVLFGDETSSGRGHGDGFAVLAVGSAFFGVLRCCDLRHLGNGMLQYNLMSWLQW